MSIFIFRKNIANYFKAYKLIYLGIILCNLSAFNFYIFFNIKPDEQSFFFPLIAFFFVISFGFPIIFGINFCIQSFKVENTRKALSNIIHSYIAIILIFSATYYQCSILGDFTDAVNKQELYRHQKYVKEQINNKISFMKVSDQRAFKGISLRLWSSVDYPELSHLVNYNGATNPDFYRTYTKGGYDDLSMDQIERIVNNTITDSTWIKPNYLRENSWKIYGDCLYYSVICIATVGFGDISPNLWYTKLFTGLEVIFGMTIFIFAIGFLFSRFSNTNQYIYTNNK